MGVLSVAPSLGGRGRPVRPYVKQRSPPPPRASVTPSSLPADGKFLCFDCSQRLVVPLGRQSSPSLGLSVAAPGPQLKRSP